MKYFEEERQFEQVIENVSIYDAILNADSREEAVNLATTLTNPSADLQSKVRDVLDGNFERNVSTKLHQSFASFIRFRWITIKLRVTMIKLIKMIMNRWILFRCWMERALSKMM